ncbi:MAG TPA: hypothetical protein VJS88_05450, partial [Chthoniobacterales bacterium]|nr:hypothetical protein [Chthoniobacterales bacterium]
MRLVLVIASSGLGLGLLASCARHHSISATLAEKHIREKEARAAALEWLALVDAADYEAAYVAEPERMRKAT